nr:MAG TPA: Phosphoethanolamine N-methyltransferase-like protein [Bacteriophage sp.]
MQPSFCRVLWDLLPPGGLFVLLFHRIRSDPAPGYIDGLRCLGVQSNITRGL